MNLYAMYKPQDRKVAYFSMEVGLRPEIPTYSGGLGILAGDTLKSFADLKVQAVGVTLTLYQRVFSIKNKRNDSTFGFQFSYGRK